MPIPTTIDTIGSGVRPNYGSKYHDRKRKFLKYFAKTTQFLVGPFVSVILRSFFIVKITGKENLKAVSSPFIIISNHISFFDSFAFRLVLTDFTYFLPLRFMAVKKFNSKYLNFLAEVGFIDVLYALFGVFTIKRGLGIHKNLEEASRILVDDGNLVIYPEGEIFTSINNIGAFRIGAAVLAQKTGASVLPVAMKITDKGAFRKRFTINIGKEIKFTKGQSISPLSVTNGFREEIFELYKKI